MRKIYIPGASDKHRNKSNDDILKLEKVCEIGGIMKAVMPKEILAELRMWVKECRKIKNHPLAELKAHENVGYLAEDGEKHNTYQVAVPSRLVDEGYWMPYLLRLVAKYYANGKDNRSYKLRTWLGHFDAYDVWMNFTNKGDDNPKHHHTGFLSGVAYIQNDGQPTVFPDYDFRTDPTEGNMYLWPAVKAWHLVEKKTTKKERVSIAFNIIEIPPISVPDELGHQELGVKSSKVL